MRRTLILIKPRGRAILTPGPHLERRARYGRVIYRVPAIDHASPALDRLIRAMDELARAVDQATERMVAAFSTPAITALVERCAAIGSAALDK
jgi:hypothetical protein